MVALMVAARAVQGFGVCMGQVCIFAILGDAFPAARGMVSLCTCSAPPPLPLIALLRCKKAAVSVLKASAALLPPPPRSGHGLRDFHDRAGLDGRAASWRLPVRLSRRCVATRRRRR